MSKQVQKNEVTSTPTYDVEGLLKKFVTKSAVIRHLDSQGVKRGEIAKLLDIKYQHVRNVLITPLKKTES